MSRPLFARLSAGYPRKPLYERAELYKMIGWDNLIDNLNYYNTCAVRVSIALASAGVALPGRMAIKAGPLKGKLIEPGQARLAHLLARKSMLGVPEKFQGQQQAKKGIGQRRGVAAFFRIHPGVADDNQGHIDLVSPDSGGFLVCAGACYFSAKEVWFWPLQ